MQHLINPDNLPTKKEEIAFLEAKAQNDNLALHLTYLEARKASLEK